MSLCVKCKKEPSCIDIKFALYCSPCFLEATYHKYRTLLGRCRETAHTVHSAKGLILLPINFLDSPVLSRASRVLIHFSQLPVIQEPARKNLVDYELAVPISVQSNDQERERMKEFIVMIKREYPLLSKVHVIFIESGQVIPPESLTCLMGRFESHDIDTSLSNTLKEDLLNLKLLHTQLKLMKSLSIDKAMTPETSTSLASYILTCTCKGRGKFLPWDSALIRSFPDGLFLTRPLKEISDKEIDLYCQESQFGGFSAHSAQSQSINSMSIDRLTVNFVSNLESENPGTANVVIRTSSKVTTTNVSKEETCPICFAPNQSVCESCAPLRIYF